MEVLAARFKSPPARNRRKEGRWFSGDLRFVPESPQSELGKKEKERRSRSRHKLKKISQLSKRFVASEKSDSVDVDEVSNKLNIIFLLLKINFFFNY